MPTNRELEREAKEGEVLTAWQAALSLSGLNPDDPNSFRFLSKQAGITKAFAWEILTGRGRPSEDQIRRIIEACNPLIEARKSQGEIIDL